MNSPAKYPASLLAIWTLALAVFGGPAFGQSFEPPETAQELVAKSIEWHDPQGAWASFAYTLNLLETRLGGMERQVSVTLDLPGDRFVHHMRDNEIHVRQRLEKGACAFEIGGARTLSPELAKRHDAYCEELKRLRDYYAFLFGQPMKLRDKGVIIGEGVEEVKLKNRRAWRIKVAYAPEVGAETWYFYFSLFAHRLIGLQFFRETEDDGETIIFDRVIEVGDMRLPSGLHWYASGAQERLGVDRVTGFEPIR